MAHPLQSHFDRVSTLLRELRAALEDHIEFQTRRDLFDEFLEANELELALHAACGALLGTKSERASPEILKMIEALHQQMELRDDCVERLLAF
jgi:hypothetical protein